MNDLKDEDVKVKISTCQKCGGIVRASVVHTMDTKSKNSFAKEVMKHNLSVKEIPLLDYRKDLVTGNINWCLCKTIK